MLGKLRLEVFPNRELRATFTPEKNPSNRRKTNESHHETDSASIPVKAVTCHSLKTQNHSDSGTPEISHARKKAGFGSVGRQSRFSTYARRTILRAGGALESEVPHSECLFLTMTLPGSTNESMGVIAAWSAYIVDRFKSWLSKRVKSRYEMYVWEWQRRGALHLHYVVHCADRVIGEEIRRDLKAQWIRLLDSISRNSGVDVYARGFGFSHKNNKDVVRVDAQWCEKSVAAYLSKYVSKESKKNRDRVNSRYYPSRWYGVSRPLLQLLRKLTITAVFDNLKRVEWLTAYEDILSILQSQSLHCYSYRHEVGSGKTIVSYIEKQHKDSIWNQIMTQIGQYRDSFSNIRGQVAFSINRGLYLMRHNWRLRRTFSQLSSQYVRDVVSRWKRSEPITPADTTFLLDTLIFTFQYHRQTSMALSGAESSWYEAATALNRHCVKSGLTEVMGWTDEKLSHAGVDSGTASMQAGTSAGS